MSPMSERHPLTVDMELKLNELLPLTLALFFKPSRGYRPVNITRVMSARWGAPGRSQSAAATKRTARARARGRGEALRWCLHNG